MERPIYLDYQATTPLDPRVLEKMLPFFTENFGNAASTSHLPGQQAHDAVESARETIAANINGSPLGLVFTSGATESINLALKGVASFYNGQEKNHIITCQTEHPAVLDCCAWLEQNGFQITYLPVNNDGCLDMNLLDNAISARTLLISLMYANNETGVLHDVATIGTLAKTKGVFFHCDAVQALGKEPLDVEALGIDLLSFSAHKIYGPKGIGGLWVRRKNPRVRLNLQMHGGGHERGFRSGTLNVPGIVGLAEALQLCQTTREQEHARLQTLTHLFLARLKSLDVTFQVNGHLKNRLAGSLNLRFPGTSSAALIRLTPQIAAARGSACTSAVPAPSRVLLAMGLSADAANESLRICFGRMTTETEVNLAASFLAEGIKKVALEQATSP